MKKQQDYTRLLGRRTLEPAKTEIDKVRARIERNEAQDAEEVVVTCRWVGVELDNGEARSDRYEVTWGTPCPEGGFAVTRDSIFFNPFRRTAPR